MLTLPAEPTGRCAQLLVVDQIEAGYGRAPVISALSLSVGRGEIVSVIGPNGAGKSTVRKAVTGEIRITRGQVTLGDRDITNERAERLPKLGVGYVPQSDDVFVTMTVVENLEMGGYLLRRRELADRIEEVLEMFPALGRMRHRTVSKLSGGERKMVAVGRVLMLRPSVLILDEPTAGLSVELSRVLLAEHVRRLAQAGVAVMLIEQKATEALEISQWGYVLVSGSAKISAPAAELLARDDIGEVFLGRDARAG